jgi:hypothetical protein
MIATGRGRDGKDRATRVLADNVLYEHVIRRSLCDHRPTKPFSGHVTGGVSALILL